MHIESVNAQIIRGQIDALEDLLESQVPIVSVHYNLIRILLHFTFDETQ